ncbi:hypothetical protein IU443_29345 [Nocardia farcinica]|uniref:hypothetical protein n=1 Tax=Nocardia farcinica TaxID=37329 RepID=UPI0018939C29|nr:hypothetical protein [Nocardia farcinica]MBF6394039.1 hypothetical protein [Nocardia farcinica]
MPERTPRLTAEELEALREATLQHYEAAGYPDELTDRLRAYTDEPDGGLINLIDMASSLARSHEAALERIAELEVELDRLRERRRTWLLRFRTASARVAELEAQREPIGYLIVTEVEGRRVVHGDHRQLMTCAEAIESVGRSDLPRGMRHLLCTVQEADR